MPRHEVKQCFEAKQRIQEIYLCHWHRRNGCAEKTIIPRLSTLAAFQVLTNGPVGEDSLMHDLGWMTSIQDAVMPACQAPNHIRLINWAFPLGLTDDCVGAKHIQSHAVFHQSIEENRALAMDMYHTAVLAADHALIQSTINLIREMDKGRHQSCERFYEAPPVIAKMVDAMLQRYHDWVSEQKAWWSKKKVMRFIRPRHQTRLLPPSIPEDT
jgi:hypothetical protein